MSVKVPKGEMLIEEVFSGLNDQQFKTIALRIFLFQCKYNKLYRNFVRLMQVEAAEVKELNHIPFLPVSFFKTHTVVCGKEAAEHLFESSGTTGAATSRHHVTNIQVYQTAFTRGFELFYGPVADYCILGLLPSYLERQNSSLVYMVDRLMKKSAHPMNKFYLHDFKGLSEALKMLEKKGQKTILFGVTYALLDFGIAFPVELKNTIIIETGGMKGRKREMIREEVHHTLKAAFSTGNIHSEYGMSELLSQAYAGPEGLFCTPPWMKMLLREEDDPKNLIFTTNDAVSGVINIIDLSNIYSCSFIATEDAGRLHRDGTVKVLGRLDNSDIRGCSLLAL